MTRLLHVVGARPNFMKVAPLLRVPASATHVLVHTGQHYDVAMSDAFFRDLELPAPDAHLGVGSGSHAEQTARMLLALEPVFDRYAPDWVVVYGDVNSTLAAALVAQKKGIRVAHVEAGVRSFDRTMPEETNRVLTDQLADLCLTPSASADANLRREGVPDERIRTVGNVMVDTLLALRPRATALGMPARFGVADRGYAVATFHRAGNVDDGDTLREIVRALADLAASMPVLFPVHPRTRARLQSFGLAVLLGDVRLIEPQGYLETIGLVERARLVLTDSGGLQVETMVLGVPCLTVRTTTEWSETVTAGTNRLVPPTGPAIRAAIELVCGTDSSAAVRSPLWDGRAAERAVAAILGASLPDDP
jgi:UDP-N-acetylglucosamine 2-epimerase (non-hydrolysing)